MSVPELYIQPHLDDVALSAGGTLALASEPLVVTVFCQAPAPDAPLSAFAREIHRRWGDEPGPIFELRRGEDEAAMTMFDARTQYLAYEDAIYRGYATPAALRGPPDPDDAAVSTLTAELVELWRGTDGARVYLPLAIGGHVDHRVVYAAGTALHAAGATVWYYEDFPYVVVDGALADRLREVGELAPVVVDVTATIDRRVAAIAAYASQLPTLFRSDGPFPGPYETLLRKYAGALATSGYAERFWIHA